jgi:hypothetical protein
VASSLAAPSQSTKAYVTADNLLFFITLVSKISVGSGFKCPKESTGGSLCSGMMVYPILALRQDTWKTGCMLASFGSSSL